MWIYLLRDCPPCLWTLLVLEYYFSRRHVHALLWAASTETTKGVRKYSGHEATLKILISLQRTLARSTFADPLLDDVRHRISMTPTPECAQERF